MKRLLTFLTSISMAFASMISTPVQGKEDTSRLEVVYFDVGQANSALADSDGHYLLADGGNRSDSSLLYTYLRDHQIDKLDLVIGTHAHEDHIGGIAGALNYAKADQILCPVTSFDSKAFSNFKKYADKNGGIHVPKAGDIYSLGKAEVKILYLDPAAENINDSSIIFTLSQDEVTYLFPGDAEQEELNKVLNSPYREDLDADVLLLSHHGGENGISSVFLDAVSPEICIMSVGKDNQYGHPQQSVIDLLLSRNIPLYRTDLQGDITCKGTSHKPVCEPEKNKDADVYTAAKGKEQTSETAPSPAPAAPAAQAPANSYHYVLNTRSKLIHLPGCSALKTMKDKNKEDSNLSISELEAQGYRPCKRCNPH